VDDQLIAIPLTGLAVITTFAGGYLALRLSHSLPTLIALSGGVVVAVALFEVLPEAIELLPDDPSTLAALMGAGFLTFFLFERVLVLHHRDDPSDARAHGQVGALGALGLSAHSFVDGLAVGLAFGASTEVGVLVLIAVLSHDFADGLNTVSLMLAHGNTTRRSLLLLALDALAPFLGALSTLLFQVPPDVLALYLGFFAGFLLYISAADILPEAHSRQPARLTIVMTCLGALFIFLVIRVAE
jgi:zinc transporter ZupT